MAEPASAFNEAGWCPTIERSDRFVSDSESGRYPLQQYPRSQPRVILGNWAYTVLRSGASNQFYTGNETFGPRWTSLMDPAHAPVLLVRRLGAGEVVVVMVAAPQPRREDKGLGDHEASRTHAVTAEVSAGGGGKPDSSALDHLRAAVLRDHDQLHRSAGAGYSGCRSGAASAGPKVTMG